LLAVGAVDEKHSKVCTFGDFRKAYTWRTMPVDHLQPDLHDHMVQLVTTLRGEERDFVASFLSCGVGVMGDDQASRQAAARIERTFPHLDEKLAERAERQFKTEEKGPQFKERVTRGCPEQPSCCSTIDYSLQLGQLSCPSVLAMLQASRPVSLLKVRRAALDAKHVGGVQRVYEKVYPTKTLTIVNHGIFSSPPGNPGQAWHTDCDVPSSLAAHIYLPDVVTVTMACSQQAAGSGATEFALYSHRVAHKLLPPLTHTQPTPEHPDEIPIMFPVLQIQMAAGQFIAFRDDLSHRGSSRPCV